MKSRTMLAVGMIGCLGWAIAAGQPGTVSATQPEKAAADDLQAVLEVFRSDFNTSKIRTINRVLKLTGPEAEKFWPIYREYETELAALGDRKVGLIREFVGLHRSEGLNDTNASALAEKWLGIKQAQLDLWKKYHRLISERVSPVRAAQFLQVEHQISLLVDINIASEMPLVGQPTVDEPAAPPAKPSTKP